MNPRNVSLMGAVTDGDTEAVRALLAAGSDVNRTASGGQTPLILAILFRRTQIMSLLLEAGADPQLRDSLGLNAVDWAERKGFAEGVKLLAQGQSSKQETPRVPPSTEPAPARGALPNQIERQNTRDSRGSNQPPSAEEKSRQWLAGLKRRIDEEASQKVQEVQPAPPPPTTGINPTRENELPPVVSDSLVVSDSPVQASALVPEPAVISAPSSPAERPPKVQPDALLKNQTSASQAIKPLLPPDDFASSEPPWSAIRTQPTSKSRQRCPKCNTVYGSDLLAYCAIDATALVDVNEPVVTSPPESSSMPLVWLLIVLTFIVAGGFAYFMIPDLKSEQTALPATSPTEAVSIGDGPLVAGGLSGKQIDVPAAEYPAIAKREHVSGTVTVRVTVNKKGRVIAVKVLEGDWRLRQAALAAAQKATFSDEKLMGRTEGTIAYTFKE